MKNEQKISFDDLYSAFSCDAENGVLRHKNTVGRRRAGDIAGFRGDDGYFRVGIRGTTVALHRVIWAMHYGEWPSRFIDHRDCDKSNNSISNLRLASDSENSSNRRKVRGNSSYKGVFWFGRWQKWVARITKGRKVHHLGVFDTQEAAYAAYVQKAKELHGEFARLA